MSASNFFVGAPNRMASKGREFDTLDEAITFLYAALHADKMWIHGLGVHNPHPKQYDSVHIFPQDTFLTEDQEKMEKMDLQEFVRHGKKLIANGVPAISVTADFGEKRIRVSCYLFQPSIYQKVMRTNQYGVLLAAYTNNPRERENTLIQYNDTIEQWYQENSLK